MPTEAEHHTGDVIAEARAQLAERDRRAVELAEAYARDAAQDEPDADRRRVLAQALLEACRDLTPMRVPEEETTKAGEHGW